MWLKTILNKSCSNDSLIHMINCTFCHISIFGWVVCLLEVSLHLTPTILTRIRTQVPPAHWWHSHYFFSHVSPFQKLFFVEFRHSSLRSWRRQHENRPEQEPWILAGGPGGEHSSCGRSWKTFCRFRRRGTMLFCLTIQKGITFRPDIKIISISISKSFIPK